MKEREREGGRKGSKRKREEWGYSQRNSTRYFATLSGASGFFLDISTCYRLRLTSPFLTSAISRSVQPSFPPSPLSQSVQFYPSMSAIEGVDMTLQSLPILFTFPEIPSRDDCRREQRDTPFHSELADRSVLSGVNGRLSTAPDLLILSQTMGFIRSFVRSFASGRSRVTIANV